MSRRVRETDEQRAARAERRQRRQFEGLVRRTIGRLAREERQQANAERLAARAEETGWQPRGATVRQDAPDRLPLHVLLGTWEGQRHLAAARIKRARERIAQARAKWTPEERLRPTHHRSTIPVMAPHALRVPNEKGLAWVAGGPDLDATAWEHARKHAAEARRAAAASAAEEAA